MATIYIPVEVPDSEVVRLSTYAELAGLGAPAQPVPTQAAPQPQSDPWASSATTAPSPAVAQPVSTPTAPAATSTSQGGTPHCQHGEMRYVPAGHSRSTGKAYQAFYGCPAPRGAVQCKSVKA